MKKTIIKIICTVLVVAILTLSVGTKYFDSNHIEKVEAAGTIVIAGGITLATLFEFCLFVGTTALAAYGIYEGYENREEIARFGKEFIDSCGDTVDGWVAQIVDATGQDYVFGSEALELIQNTEWSVIQGGMPPDGDPNKKDDKDKDKFHIPGDPLTHVAQFTALGATWFTTNAQKMYAEWCDYLDGWNDKEMPFPENNVLINNFPQSVTAADIAAQWSGESYNYSSHVRFSFSFQNTGESDYHYSTETYNFSKDSISPVCCYIKYDYAPKELSFWFMSLDSYGNPKNFTVDSVVVSTHTYKGKTDTSTYSNTCYYVSNLAYPDISFSANCPVFSSRAAAENYLKGLTPATDALNYAKSYRLGDWLKQDWEGTLIDPLVNIGLTLSQLIELMKQLGLKALQGLTAEQLLELLKRTLPKIDPDLLPGATPAPAVDPALDPIYYPNPDAHPDKPPRPIIDPVPVIKPDPTPTPTPDPLESESPWEIDIPIPDIVPTVESSFGDIAGSIRYKFPFSIPWDLRHLFVKLSDTPKVPRFELPIRLKKYGIDEKIIVDLKDFQKISNLSRSMFSMIFLIGLIKFTMLVVGMRKEE